MGSGISTAKPLGNNGSDVSWQTPFGGTNSFMNQAALPVAGTMMGGPLLGLGAGLAGAKNGGFATTALRNPGEFLAHGVNTQQAMANQRRGAQNQANTAGLQGQAFGNSLGGGGMASHYNNVGYNQGLSSFAQMISGQNSQAQGQAMQGLGALMALLPFLL